MNLAFAGNSCKTAFTYPDIGAPELCLSLTLPAGCGRRDDFSGLFTAVTYVPTPSWLVPQVCLPLAGMEAAVHMRGLCRRCIDRRSVRNLSLHAVIVPASRLPAARLNLDKNACQTFSNRSPVLGTNYLELELTCPQNGSAVEKGYNLLKHKPHSPSASIPSSRRQPLHPN